MAVVPEPLARGNSYTVADEQVLEEVEQTELSSVHDIGLGIFLDFIPNLKQDIDKQGHDHRIGGITGTLASNRQRLRDSSIASFVWYWGSRRGWADRRNLLAMRHETVQRVSC